ncbi:MAG: hypothetical protein IKS69_01640 [Erysipelotrichaceae bacterium]|nr:hypothetical protein [Erysipelotrichaceae bacterium]
MGEKIKEIFNQVKDLVSANKTVSIAIAAGIVLLLIMLIVMIRKGHKKRLKKELDDLYVRFNDVKTVPIAFKLSKAQIMAKRNKDTSESVAEYYRRYEETEKHISELQEQLNDVEDSLNSTSYKEALQSLQAVAENMSDCEKEIKDIDVFLEAFSKKEDEQRDYSVKLKEKYRVVKSTIDKNSQLLSIAYEGFVNKLKECEELFSASEEAMMSSEYGLAQDDLEKIEKILEDIKTNANAVPTLVKDTKGVIPLMLDETKRELALTKQRGVYTDHLQIEERIEEIERSLSSDVKNIMEANTEGVKKNVAHAKDVINELNEILADENKAYRQAKETNDKAYEHLADMEKVENYVRVAYEKDSDRYGLSIVSDTLDQIKENIAVYRQQYTDISADLSAADRPSAALLESADDLYEHIENDKKALYAYKSIIDKSTDGEQRAISQLTKLQLVVCEVEAKLAEYSLPAIDDSYKDDLARAHGYIDRLRSELEIIPIDVDKLNELLAEAIDFIYKFYNNINNVVGMGVMVENAIVFGNRYRSTYPEIDRELSKAEFQYLNGEYTKALKTAITCMETLFPESIDEKIMENY